MEVRCRIADAPVIRARLARFLFGRAPVATIVFVLLGLIAAEVLLQARSHWRFGRSVFNVVWAEPTRVPHPELSFATFRPNATIDGSQAAIVTNSLGLRSPEIPRAKPPERVRLAFLGASTIFGAYARTNERRMSDLVAAGWSSRLDGRKVDFVNAAFPGLGLAQQAELLDRFVLPWQPDVVVLYPGTNDFHRFCARTEPTTAAPPARALPAPTPPSWLLSIELVRKNTAALRETPLPEAAPPPPSFAALPELQDQLAAMIEEIRAAGAVPLVVTLTRAFRPEQPVAAQREHGRTFLYSYPCFTLDQAHRLYDVFNDVLRATAAELDAPLLDLAARFPGDPSLFADATHFNYRGEQRFAELVLAALARPPLRALAAAPPP